MHKANVTLRADTAPVATVDSSPALTTITQAYRFAIDPSPEQANLFRSHIGGSRFAYNALLGLIVAVAVVLVQAVHRLDHRATTHDVVFLVEVLDRPVTSKVANPPHQHGNEERSPKQQQDDQ